MIRNRILNILKRKELYFIIIVYSMLFIATKWLTKLLYPITNNPENMSFYAYTSLCVFALIILAVLFTLAQTFYKHRLQGDKLNLRQKEGININIGEINNGKKSKS